MKSDRFLTVHFIDGSEMSVTFPKQGGNPLLLAKRVQEAIESRLLHMERDIRNSPVTTIAREILV